MITKLITWMNENEGALMVIITLAYVIATLFICKFNWMSARASRDQIVASQKQQEQNSGLQLYSIRSTVINRIWKYQFEEVFWDVHMLFDKKISDEFNALFEEHQKLNKSSNEIKSFEEELNYILPKQAQYSIVTQIENAKKDNNYGELEKALRKIFTDINYNDQVLKSVENYIDTLIMIDKTQKSINDKLLELTLEMRKFTQGSILMH